jgi:hypothetical protein
MDLRLIDNKFVELLLEEYFADNNSVVNDFFIVKIADLQDKKVYRFTVWLFRPTDNKIDKFNGYISFFRNKVSIRLPYVKEIVVDKEIITRTIQLYMQLYRIKQSSYEIENL